QISALPDDLFYSQVIDVSYINGLTWGRIPGIRFLYHPNEKVTMGVSLEQSTQYFGGSGGGGIPILPAALATAISPQLDQNLINGIQIPRLAPDVIGKIAFSHRRDREVPSTENFEIVKNLRLITNNFWSSGEGRYLFGLAPNFIVQANGKPSP